MAQWSAVVVISRIQPAYRGTLLVLAYLALSACLANKDAPALPAPLEANADTGVASETDAAEFTGHVVGVTDGDSLRVMHNGRAEPVRLVGIDCPEKGQAFGKRAKQATAALAFDRDVIVLSVGKDRYRRTLATIVLPDGRNLNHELVRDGWCWWFRQYAPFDEDLERLEHDAREKKRGLWIDPAPTPPWVYRKAWRE